MNTTNQIADVENDAKPEFCSAAKLPALFGISRTTAYRLLADNEIKVVKLRKRGNKAGRTLFCCDSIRDFFRRNMAPGL